MQPVPIDQNGKIDIQFIKNLELDDLKEWVTRRLSGHDPYFPSGGHWDEVDPISIFVWAWEQTDPGSLYHERLTKIVQDLLNKTLAKPESYSVKWLDSLFSLTTELRIKFNFSKLKRAFENPLIRQASYTDHGIDQVLLAALAVQGSLRLKDFWREQLKDIKYAAIALFALEAYGLEAIKAGLSNFLETYLRKNRIKQSMIVLIDLFERVGLQKSKDELLRSLPQHLQDEVMRVFEPYNIFPKTESDQEQIAPEEQDKIVAKESSEKHPDLEHTEEETFSHQMADYWKYPGFEQRILIIGQAGPEESRLRTRPQEKDFQFVWNRKGGFIQPLRDGQHKLEMMH